jgi:hypothetical protein
MRNWLKALFSETLTSVWLVLSTLSTLSTFFFPALSGKLRLGSVISLVIGFAWANYRIFQKQEANITSLETELESLRTAVASREERTSRLRITSDGKSRYILPVENVSHADFNGGFFEFHLMVENIGNKNSTVVSYDVEVAELHETFTKLQPLEGQNTVRGRHCVQGLDPRRILSKTGLIKVDADNATDWGTLLFSIPSISMEQFAYAGLRMEGNERKFGALHCRLTLTDTMNSWATEEFELHEE